MTRRAPSPVTTSTSEPAGAEPSVDPSTEVSGAGAALDVHSPDHVGASHGVEAQPTDRYFDVMASIAETHWWYRARRAWVAQSLRGRVRPGAVAIDVGTGTAETLDTLRELGAGTVVGTDLSMHALAHAGLRRPRPQVLRSLASDLPLPDRCADVLVSLEVLEHLDDDVAAVREYRRVLRDGATLLVTVPAYQWLWSEHDDWAAHRRRYDAATFERAVRAGGFEPQLVTYYFSFLVPPAFLLRRTPLKRVVKATDDEVSAMHPLVDRFFAGLAAAERAAGRRWRIPFGLSILCVAEAV